MARTSARARPEREEVMAPERQSCPGCGAIMPLRYDNHRTPVMLGGPVRLRLKIRRCEREAMAAIRNTMLFMLRDQPGSLRTRRAARAEHRQATIRAARAGVL